MFEHDDHRPDDPEGTDVAEGALWVIVALITLPFLVLQLVYRFFRYYLIEVIEDSPFAKRARDRSKDRAM